MEGRMKCPKCGEKMVLNEYALAKRIGCVLFCHNCNLHATEYGKFITDEDIVEVNPYTYEEEQELKKRLRN